MMHAVAGSEENLTKLGVVLGIIGMSRSAFDTMLRPLPTGTDTGKSKASMLVFPCGLYTSCITSVSLECYTFILKSRMINLAVVLCTKSFP